MITKIVAGVHCTIFAGNIPTYSLYIDGELMIMRRFLWRFDREYVEEQMEADLAAGCYRINIISDPSDSLQVKTLVVNEKLIDGHSFIIE